VTATKAADLPQGSVVANSHIAIVRVIPGIGFVWHGTDKRRYTDEDVDGLLFADGFVVLREGMA
jgi:hypothetical protein